MNCGIVKTGEHLDFATFGMQSSNIREQDLLGLRHGMYLLTALCTDSWIFLCALNIAPTLIGV